MDSLTSGEAENLGGGGGGGIALGGDGGIPLDNGLINFFGGSIVDTFLKTISSDCSQALKGSNLYSEFKGEQENQKQLLNKDIVTSCKFFQNTIQVGSIKSQHSIARDKSEDKKQRLNLDKQVGCKDPSEAHHSSMV